MPGELSSQQRAFIAGGVAGVTEALVTMPMEVTKNRLQMGHGPPGILASMRDTVRVAGPQGLWFGIQPQLVQVGGKAAVPLAGSNSGCRVAAAWPLRGRCHC